MTDADPEVEVKIGDLATIRIPWSRLTQGHLTRRFCIPRTVENKVVQMRLFGSDDIQVPKRPNKPTFIKRLISKDHFPYRVEWDGMESHR
jgi:hypothetical protein